MSRVILIAALLLASLGLQAQTEEIDRYLLSAGAAYKFNGVALIARKGEILLHKAYGWKDFSSKAYNDTNTIFPILSVTKSFTAMTILKLQDQKKLALGDKVNKYLPDFPNGDKISIEHLLTHTSGLYNYTDDIGEEDSAIINHPVQKQQVLDMFSNKPLAYAPGKGFGYNNSGYYLAGIVIEKATGKLYEQNVRELILDPLGMQNSGFDFNGLQENRRATGYQFLDATTQKTYKYVDSTVGYSAGSIYSTTGDLYKWTQAIAKRQLLSPASWKLAFTPRAGDYGIGFRINNFFGRKYVRHSGGYPGFVSEFVYYPGEDVTIILLKNSGNYGEDLWPITMGLSSIVFGLPYDSWKARAKINLPDSLLKEKEGRYKAGNLILTFVVKDNSLYEVLPNGAELALFAESLDSFYLENFNTEVRFVKNEKGIYEKVIIHEHGKDTELKKIE